MLSNENVVAIISARGDSKGIPGKNIHPILDKPLISYSIEAALNSDTISRIIVSTDDAKIAKVAQRCGADVVMRPDEISGENDPSELTLLHVLKYLEEGEGLEHLKTSIAFILWQQENITKNLSIDSEDYFTALNSVNKKVFTATAYPGTEIWNVVRPKLKKHFNISFTQNGLPECDKYFLKYVLELDDATKVLNDKNNEPVYYGNMKLEEFLTARDHVDNGNIHEILSM